MVGRLGPVEIAAIGMGNTIRTFLLILVLSVSAGAMSLTAQSIGNRDLTKLSKIVKQAVISGFILGLVIMVMGLIFSKPLLLLMDQGNVESVVPTAWNYLIIIFIGAPFLVFNMTFNRMMQGAGDTLTPLYITAAVIILNIFFNYIFIFGKGPLPPMGVVGAALGTVLARTIAALFQIYLFYSGKNIIKILPGNWTADWRLISDIYHIGIPSGLQGIFRRGSNLFMIGLITATELGTYGAAGLAIGWQLETLIVQPIVGINVSSTALIGSAVGRWQIQEAYYKGNVMIFIGIIISVVLTIPILLGASPLVNLFDPSLHPLVLKGALGYIFICIASIPLGAASIVITGNLRGAGDTRPAMMSALIFRGITAVALAYLFAFPLGMNSYGVWLGILCGRVVDTFYMILKWKSKKWKDTALARTEIFRCYLSKLNESNLASYLTDVRQAYMASPGTVEKVDNIGVTYVHNQDVTQFIFENKGYRKLK